MECESSTGVPEYGETLTRLTGTIEVSRGPPDHAVDTLKGRSLACMATTTHGYEGERVDHGHTFDGDYSAICAAHAAPTTDATSSVQAADHPCGGTYPCSLEEGDASFRARPICIVSWNVCSLCSENGNVHERTYAMLSLLTRHADARLIQEAHCDAHNVGIMCRDLGGGGGAFGCWIHATRLAPLVV